MLLELPQNGLLMLGKIDDIMGIIEQAILTGFGCLPAVYAVKFYLERN